MKETGMNMQIAARWSDRLKTGRRTQHQRRNPPLTAAGGGLGSQGASLPSAGNRSSRTQPSFPVETLRKNVHVPPSPGA
jgi:hypothetical protein